jgi:hypothetical protein
MLRYSMRDELVALVVTACASESLWAAVPAVDAERLAAIQENW